MAFKTEIKKVKQYVITECDCDRCGNHLKVIDYYGVQRLADRGLNERGVGGLFLQHTGNYLQGAQNRNISSL